MRLVTTVATSDKRSSNRLIVNIGSFLGPQRRISPWRSDARLLAINGTGKCNDTRLMVIASAQPWVWFGEDLDLSWICLERGRLRGTPYRRAVQRISEAPEIEVTSPLVGSESIPERP